MEGMHVENLSFVIFGICGLSSLVIFLGLLFLCKKRGGGKLLPFWVGCGTFLLFAMVLESLFHQLILRSPVGPAIFNGTWTYALYGGLAAGVFEETGRLVAMRWLKKKDCGPNTDLVYGAGHGGIEALLVLGITMAQYIIFGVMINSGTISELLEPMDEVSREAAMPLLQQIAGPASWESLLGICERIPAVAAHVSFSVLVWKAVTAPGKFWLYPAAIALHAAFDFVFALLAKLGMNMLLVEASAAIGAVLLCVIAVKVRKADAQPV